MLFDRNKTKFIRNHGHLLLLLFSPWLFKSEKFAVFWYFFVLISGYIYLSAAEGNEYLSFTDLQNLDCLEILNLERTHVDDESLCPLSRFRRLSHLLLRSPSLTDVSLSYLSILPKLTILSIRDAVLTNQAFDLLKPAATLQKIDLRGCWLLTEDGLLEFHRRFPQIEVRHELFHFSSDQTSSDRPSTHFTPKKLQLNQRNKSAAISPFFVGM